MNNSTKADVPVAAAFGTVIALGFPLNAVSLWILLHRHSLKSPNAVFMVNLMISDLLLVISLPTRVYFYATGVWPLGDMACIFSTMLFRNNIRSSSIFITCICVDRLLAVVFPLKSRHLRTSSNAWKVAAITWIFLVIINTPESVSLKRTLKSHTFTCFEFERGRNEMNETTIGDVIRYFQPVLVFSLLTVNVVCTVLVSWTLCTHLNSVARVNKKVNVMVIFVVNLLMFAVFFLPLSVVSLSEALEEYRTRLLVLGSINCCMDPLLYYFSLDGFWRKNDPESTHVSENSRQAQVALTTG